MQPLSRTYRLKKRRNRFFIQLFFILCSILILILIPIFPSALILEQGPPLNLSSSKQNAYSTNQVEREPKENEVEVIGQAEEYTNNNVQVMILGEQLDAKYKQIIQNWINQISKDSYFDEWSYADWSSYVLEEKEESNIWVILGMRNEVEVGYIILEELTGRDIEDSHKQVSLREYGINDRNILSRFIKDHHSLHSFDYAGVVWSQHVEEELHNLFYQVSYYQVDKPHHSNNWSGQPTNQLIQQKKLLYNELIQPLAILPQQKEHTPNSVLEDEPYYYYTQLSEGKNAIFPVKSIHSWNDQNDTTHIQFFGIENEGIRYFPEEYLQQSGQIISFDRSIFDENTF